MGAPCTSSSLRVAALWLASCSLACTAEISGQSANKAAGPGLTGAAGMAGTSTAPADLRLPPSAGMRRLTSDEFASSLRDVLGVAPTAAVEPDTRLDGFEKVGAARAAVSPVGTELYQQAIYGVLDAIWADSARLGALVPCDASAEGCAAQVLSSVGRLAWRRALGQDEIGRYVALAQSASTLLGDPSAGLEQALAGLFQSPYFLYRLELGGIDPEVSTRLKYSGSEMATRLSYFLVNSTPDVELLAAAERGDLDNTGGLREQARRLLSGASGHESIRGFASELLNLPALDGVPKDLTLYPDFTPALRASLREEVERIWETAAFGAGHQLLDVLTTRETFVDAGLAALYGVASPSQSGMSPVTLPEGGLRAGLLGTGAFLAARAKTNETTPTLRGRFVREVLMCQSVPPPPPNVNTTLPQGPVGVVLTRRLQLEMHRASPTCAACHALMDPIGLAFENFDAIGRERQQDRGLPIDASGELDGAPFSGPAELSQLLHERPDVRSCLVRSLYRYALGQNESAAGEGWVSALTATFEGSGQRFGDFSLNFVTSDVFRFAALPATGGAP